MADDIPRPINGLLLGLFPPRKYTNESLRKLYNFSQEKELIGDITFDFIENGQSVPLTFNFNQFRELITLACIVHLQKQENVIVTEEVTVIGNYYRDKLYQTNLGLPIVNTKYLGSLTIQELKNKVRNVGNKYIVKTNEMNNTNIKKERYRMNLRDQIETAKYIKTKHNTNPRFIFTDDSKASFVQKYKTTFQHEQAPANLIVIIPIKLTPFMTDLYELNSHAQYCIIDKSRKTYMIVDSQYDGADNTYKKLLFTEAERLSPFIEEITGEQYEPYFYSVQCPQAVVRDRNCIWWSLLILYMYLQSDQTTVDLRVLLLQIQSIGGADEYVQALDAFKVYVMEDIVKPMMESGALQMSSKLYNVSKLISKLEIEQAGSGRKTRITRRRLKHKRRTARR